MRRIAIACLFAAGCDRLFDLERIEAPTDSGASDGIGPTDDATGDAMDTPCGNGWTLNPVTQTYYKVMPALRNWTDARLECKSMPSGSSDWRPHLVVFKNTVEYAFVRSLPGVVGTPWVGAYDYDTVDMFSEFIWVTAEVTPVAPWDTNQPDNTDVQNCAQLGDLDGMDNSYCSQSHPFICECDAYPDTL